MIKTSVRMKKKKSELLDYSKLPNELENVVTEPLSDIAEKEANINHDGKQWLVRFPNDVANAIGIKKGDKIRFRVVLPSPKINQQEEIEIRYIRGETGEKPG